MQYDMERFDQPLVDETQPKAHMWTDIGDAEVEYSMFGNAKVRVYRKQDEVRGALRWTLLSMSLVVGAVWLIHDASRQPGISYVTQSRPAVGVVLPEVQKPVRVAPPVKPFAAPSTSNTASQLQASSAPVAVRPLLRAPVVISGASAPVPAKPAPTAIHSEAFRAPVDFSSAVNATH